MKCVGVNGAEEFAIPRTAALPSVFFPEDLRRAQIFLDARSC